MSKLSPSSVKKDFGLKEGRLTLPPSAEYSSPGANYIAAASSLPLATSTPAQREMLQYKITWTEKVRNVFRFKKKKKGGFNTDPDVVHHPQPFSRAVGRGAKVHSTPKLFDPSMVSVENLARHSSSEDDIPESLLDDTLPVKVMAGRCTYFEYNTSLNKTLTLYTLRLRRRLLVTIAISRGKKKRLRKR